MVGLGATVGNRGAVAGGSSGTGMGLVTYSLGIHQKAAKAGAIDRDLSDPMGFLDACRDFGAGGMQFPLGPGGEATVRDVREAAEKRGMHVEAIVGLPKAESEMECFERELVPALTPGYRGTFADLRDEDIDRTMALVRAKGAREPLAEVSRLGVAEQLALEQHSVERSIRYAREQLGI